MMMATSFNKNVGLLKSKMDDLTKLSVIYRRIYVNLFSLTYLPNLAPQLTSTLDTIDPSSLLTDIAFYGGKEKNIPKLVITSTEKLLLFYSLCHNYALKLYVRLNDRCGLNESEQGEVYSQNALMLECLRLKKQSKVKLLRKEYEKTFREIEDISYKLTELRKEFIENLKSLIGYKKYSQILVKETFNYQCPVKEAYINELRLTSGQTFRFLYKSDQETNSKAARDGANNLILMNLISASTKLYYQEKKRLPAVTEDESKIVPTSLCFEDTNQDQIDQDKQQKIAVPKDVESSNPSVLNRDGPVKAPSDSDSKIVKSSGQLEQNLNDSKEKKKSSTVLNFADVFGSDTEDEDFDSANARGLMGKQGKQQPSSEPKHGNDQGEELDSSDDLGPMEKPGKQQPSSEPKRGSDQGEEFDSSDDLGPPEKQGKQQPSSEPKHGSDQGEEWDSSDDLDPAVKQGKQQPSSEPKHGNDQGEELDSSDDLGPAEKQGKQQPSSEPKHGSDQGEVFDSSDDLGPTKKSGKQQPSSEPKHGSDHEEAEFDSSYDLVPKDIQRKRPRKMKRIFVPLVQIAEKTESSESNRKRLKLSRRQRALQLSVVPRSFEYQILTGNTLVETNEGIQNAILEKLRKNFESKEKEFKLTLETILRYSQFNQPFKAFFLLCESSPYLFFERLVLERPELKSYRSGIIDDAKKSLFRMCSDLFKVLKNLYRIRLENNCNELTVDILDTIFEYVPAQDKNSLAKLLNQPLVLKKIETLTREDELLIALTEITFNSYKFRLIHSITQNIKRQPEQEQS